MPHSSGGGSHGGGFHGGGSHGGGSSNRVSSHYFYGARRYRRHHRHTGQDEYVYADSRPQKTTLSSVIIIFIVGLVFFGAVGFGTRSEMPHKLNGLYGTPAIYDYADQIKDEDTLNEKIDDYYVLTGICPVIYTVYDEDWSDRNPNLSTVYENLETYAYCTYVDNFSDEQHFVIVYSISRRDAERLSQGRITVPDYSWEACQGDDTDPIITEAMFKRFGHLVQDDLENGNDPGVAFETAFEYAKKDAESKLNPGSPSRIISFIRSLMPLMFTAAIIVPMLVITIKRYIKDRDVEYEEVPFDGSEPISSGSSGLSGVSAGGYAESSSGYSRSYSASASTASKVGAIIGLVFMIPFLITGVGLIIGGIVLLSNVDQGVGGFMLIFGIIWSALSALMFFKTLSALFKAKSRDVTAPLTAEYPKAEYPKADYPDASPFADNDPVSSFTPPQDTASPFVPLKDQTEFDPCFFEPAKSNIEDDDEDYKRMKRKGYE